MVVCKICGATTPDGAQFCEKCGTPIDTGAGQNALIFGQAAEPVHDAKLDSVQPPEVPPTPVPGKPRKKKTALIVAIVCVVLVAALLVVGYFTIHIWEEATCTDAAVCKICGKEGSDALGHEWKKATCTDPKVCVICNRKSGEALGHDWKDATCVTPKTCATCGKKTGNPTDHNWLDATCEEPVTCENCGDTQGRALGHKWMDATCIDAETCSVCGKENGKALGHDWIDATYDTLKTCRRCAATEGELKGYVGDVGGEWTDEQFNRNYARVSVVKLDRYLENCFRLTVDVTIHSVNYGSTDGTWQIFVRGEDGQWVKIHTFTLSSDHQSVEIELAKPVSFQDIVVIRQVNSDSSFSYSYTVRDVQLRVD